ncbi:MULTISPECIES: hypothetical protein [unclassified Sinorhizobium]|uniref:DUF7940 domain-containing protein n=1 Tax=unclassified Sinorhizobium TaxID=2613772 RepID=UPI003523139C
MKLASDWKRVLRYAYSVRLWALASLIILLEPFIGLLVDLSDDWNLYLRFALRSLSGIFGLLGIWARVTKQKEFEDGR